MTYYSPTAKKILKEQKQRIREIKKKQAQEMKEWENRPEFKSYFKAVNCLKMPHVLVMDEVGENTYTHGQYMEAEMAIEGGTLNLMIGGKYIVIPLEDLKKLGDMMGEVKKELGTANVSQIFALDQPKSELKEISNA